MDDEETKGVSDDLRRLASWVARDGVDTDHLADYMRTLLDRQLVELDGMCRYEAMILSRYSCGLPAVAVARRLRQRAWELESATPANVALRENEEGVDPNVRSALREIDDYLQVMPRRVAIWSWLPELFGAVCCLTIGIGLLLSNVGDLRLRFIAAIGCWLLCVLYATEALRIVRHS